MTFLPEEALSDKTVTWCEALGMDPAAAVVVDAPALLVTDMQKDFLLPEGLLKVWGGPAILPNTTRLIDAFRAAERPVFFTRHIYEDPERDGGRTARWWKVDRSSFLLREGTWHAELHDALRPASGERVIAKRRYSAFFGTDLELLLRTFETRSVVVTCVCTNICCEATAHDAFFRDFDVLFAIDATGATDEAAHLATIRSIQLSYGHAVTTEQVTRALPTDEEVLLFAYGSWLDGVRLRGYGLAPRSQGCARAEGHSLAIAAPAPGTPPNLTLRSGEAGEAWGTLWSFSPADWRRLAERNHGAFVPRRIAVTTPAGNGVRAVAFVADTRARAAPAEPCSDDYAALVTTALRHYGFPPAYVKRAGALMMRGGARGS